MKDFSKYSAIIIGAGDATGSALCKKFAFNGYKVCAVRRPGNLEKFKKLEADIGQAGGWVKGYGVDARDEESLRIYLKKLKKILLQ
jgi:NAD(P)-dependent dehydrogenase (short-subunit alcohol dehydrogenase family)